MVKIKTDNKKEMDAEAFILGDVVPSAPPANLMNLQQPPSYEEATQGRAPEWFAPSNEKALPSTSANSLYEVKKHSPTDIEINSRNFRNISIVANKFWAKVHMRPSPSSTDPYLRVTAQAKSSINLARIYLDIETSSNDICVKLRGEYTLCGVSLDIVIPQGIFVPAEFSVSTNMAEITMEDMQNTLMKRIELTTKHAPIHCKRLRADEISLKTSNASIEGDYEATQYLRARTSNAKIRGRYISKSDAVHLETSNASLKATVAGKNVELKTSNAELDVAAQVNSRFEAKTCNASLKALVSVPENQYVNLKVQTSCAAAHVDVSREFLGKFKVKTSNGEVFIHDLSRVTNPPEIMFDTKTSTKVEGTRGGLEHASSLEVKTNCANATVNFV
ncbi:uncharacterized protein VTP21DRAFT_2363 [Calcarisporiella thermophila]|uniref:uncharacterized protein n=1 Tax=Calcarisporiella thermophila TaxID=911321 RepID=UPI00374247D6